MKKRKNPIKEIWISENSYGIFSAIVYLTEKEAIENGEYAHKYVQYKKTKDIKRINMCNVSTKKLKNKIQ